MPQYYMFKCGSCNVPIEGPQVPAVNAQNPAVGTPYVGAKRPPGVACANASHTAVVYTGRQERLETLYELCRQDKIKRPEGGFNVAGYIDGAEFKFFKSDNLALPAVVNALLAQPKSSRASIYTNRLEATWIKHYPKIKVKSMDSLKPHEGDGATGVRLVPQNDKPWPRQVVANVLPAPLPGGGLHAAAAALHKAQVLADGSREKGLARALRYYMLATYALVDISATEAYEGLKNYVGTLLVGDDGQILAAGINTGSFRHAEVSMLLSYFRQHPTASKVPENSVIFSTLTPCKGCTGYLKVARSTNCVIYFGQEDTGTDGRKGKEISKQLSKETKAPLGRSNQKLPGDITDDDGLGVVAVGAESSIHRITIDRGLTSCMGEGSIATQIGKARNAKEILRSGSEALVQKMLKDRTGKDAESDVKLAVLQHIGQWLGTSRMAA